MGNASLMMAHLEGQELDGLACPVCGSFRLKVEMTRPKSGSVVRTRRCKPCGFKFWTAEVVTDRYGTPVGPTVDEMLEAAE